jgi:hypothetical protein
MYKVDPAVVTQRTRELLGKYTFFLMHAGFNPMHYAMDYTILKNVVMRYWGDVERLRHFHRMPRINSHKIAGYLTYWICKLRPITIRDQRFYLDNASKPLKHPHYINELFAACVGIGRLNEDRVKQSHKRVIISPELFDTFTYGLKYRVLTGDMLSMMYEVFDTASPKC